MFNGCVQYGKNDGSGCSGHCCKMTGLVIVVNVVKMTGLVVVVNVMKIKGLVVWSV